MSTTRTYKCISNYAIIKSKSSLFSSTLGILKNGSQIEVISINGLWAYFKYNNKNAYILIMFIKEVQADVTGSVTIRYLNEETNVEVLPPVTNSNLEINLYTYVAPYIAKYTVVEPSTKSVTLTEINPNQEIIFYYKENIIYGSITINYINKENNEHISEPKVYKELELGSHSYDAIEISGCKLIGDSSKSVILTEDSPNQSIVFEYTVEETVKPPEQLEPLEPFNQNEVPYISTYYIKPVVKPDEEVIIDYYITDYYHKEYVNEDYSEVFKVTVRVEGKDDIIVRNLKAGDHSISLGTFPKLDGQEQKFSILCTDKYGRNSHELFNFFLVRNDVPVKEYIMTTNDLTTYNISNTNNTTKLVSTREGLQKLLDDKQSQGFNKLRLLVGTYRIDHLAPIYIPTKFTLNMNGSTLKLHEFAGDKALMMELNNTFDSHVINGTIEGDFYNHDYKNSPNDSEWVHGISIGGEAKYSSFENLTIKDITGYGTINGIKDSRDNKLGYTYLYPRSIGDTFKLGDIDRVTGLDIESINRTTCDFRDISGYGDIGYLSVSLYLGYQGNPCGTWNLICHFYDDNKNFIKSIDAYQYRRVGVPSNAKFMRVTILNEAYPTDLSVQLFRVPTNCQFKNLKLDNCRAVGIAPQAMNNMLFEDCELTKCGTAVTRCALDAEDGWDMMQDVTFRRLNFHDNPNNDFLTCAGHNFIIEDMIGGDVYIWERTKDLVMRNSNCRTLDLMYNENIVRHGVYRVHNNNINSGGVGKNICKNIRCKTALTGIVYNSTMSKLSSNSSYFNCTINVSDSFLGYFSELQMSNCDFVLKDDFNSPYKLSFNNTYDNKCVFKDCHFYGESILADHNGFHSAKFINCIFDDVQIQPNVVAKETDEIVFINCDVNSSSKQLIEYAPFNYTKGNYTKVTFDNCNISGTSNLKLFAYGYAKPAKGSLILNDCSINLPALNIFFDCDSGYLDYIQNFNIKLINTLISEDVTMLSDVMKKYENNNVYVEIRN